MGRGRRRAAAAAAALAETNARLNQLSGFDSVVRMIKTRDLVNARTIREAAVERLEAIGASPDLSKTVKGIPAGSDQVDMQSIVRWVAKVNKENTAAIEQLISLHATATARLEG